MADRLKDSEDLKLEALFRSTPVEDDGFSDAVVSRVRRQMLIRRFTLPTAFVIGVIIAAKPFMQLASVLPKLLDVVPKGFGNLFALPTIDFVQAPTIILGIMLLGAAMMIGRMLEE
jgi:hypothetical protein